LMLEIPWQPLKFRAENRVGVLGCAGSAIVPRQGLFTRQRFPRRKVRRSADI
jgi:hypothetical protein